MKSLLARMEKRKDTWFLLAISVCFFLLRLPSLFEPNWYGDEGIYQVIGFGLRHGRLLYSGIWDNKPPFLYYLYGIFSGSQFDTRVTNLIFGLVSVWVFYILTKKLFAKVAISAWSTAIFALLIGLPTFEGNIANAENFMMVFSLFALLLIFSFAKLESSHRKIYLQNNVRLFFPGFLLGVSFLFKVVGIFDFAASVVFLFLILYTNKQSLLEELEALTSLTIGFGAPIIFIFFYFLLRGNLMTFIQSAFFSNVGYVGYGNQLIIPQGFLILKLLLLGGFVLFLFVKRKHFSKPTLFIFTWLAFSLFNAYFSQRPYTHYLLVLLPSVILAGAYAISNFQYKRLPIIRVILLLFLIILIGKTFNLYNKTGPYYLNFLQFLAGKKTVLQYYGFFDWNTPRDYEITEYIKGHLKPHQTIYIWGNDGQIYYLTKTLPAGRYIVEYHVTTNQKTFSETQKVLAQNPPQIVVLLDFNTQSPVTLHGYKQSIMIENAGIYERTL